jgi:uncharacterized damage-inducible protein DinB
VNAAELFGHWKLVRHDLLRALEMLTDEQLHFVPREGLWSLGRVARHIAEAEDGWFRYVVAGELDGWPEFAEQDTPTVESVKAFLTTVHDRTQDYLVSLDETDLDHVVTAPWGSRFPLRWVIWHVLEHEIHHRGEIYLMLGLMGREAPDV